MKEETKNPGAVALGAKGGANGKGASKRRSAEHYRKAAQIRWEKEKALKKDNAQALV